jgi:RNA polymerase sigma-70 factor (ECF subfamily)
VNNGTRTATAEAQLVDQARSGDRTAFDRLVAPYRRELHVHCYRMLGSLHDAEDLTQETLLRAWRGLGGFAGRSTVRAWLYKIATNACLNDLRRRPRLVVPADYPPAGRSAPPPGAEVSWLEPYPDRLLLDDADPADAATRRLTTSLAFLTAVQLLSARQRAVLVLRDVLAFTTAEVAELLETTIVAVDSALRRARRRVAANVPDSAGSGTEAAHQPSPADADLIDRFVAAWERADVDGIVALLAEDAVLTMPPTPLWFRGPADIGEFFATVPADGHLDQIDLVRTSANGLPALAAYAPDPATGHRQAYGVMVFATRDHAISQITGFPDPRLFAFFGLPDR